jgi:hypothetical protein
MIVTWFVDKKPIIVERKSSRGFVFSKITFSDSIQSHMYKRPRNELMDVCYATTQYKSDNIVLGTLMDADEWR